MKGKKLYHTCGVDPRLFLHEVFSLSADLVYRSIYTFPLAFGDGLSLSDIYIDKILF